MHLRIEFAALLTLTCVTAIQAQEASVPAPESIVADSVPTIPASVAAAAARYGSYRSASLSDSSSACPTSSPSWSTPKPIAAISAASNMAIQPWPGFSLCSSMRRSLSRNSMTP